MPFSQYDTEHLRRMRASLQTYIPGDPTFVTTLAAVARAILDHEIVEPARQARDAEAKAEADAAAQAKADEAAAAQLTTKTAEGAPLPPDAKPTGPQPYPPLHA